MEPAEQARLLLERASHRLSGAEIALLEQVADGRLHEHVEGFRGEDGTISRVIYDPFTRIVTEFAAYLVF